MWWRCLLATLRWLLQLHGFHPAKPKAREESVSACAADNAASVTLRPKTVCWGVKANDGFVTRHAVTFKEWNGDGHFFLIISWTISQHLSHSYFLMVHIKSSWTYFPSQCLTWQLYPSGDPNVISALYVVCTECFIQLDLLLLYICFAPQHKGKCFSISLGHCLPRISFMGRGTDRIEKISLRVESLICL